MEIEVYTLYSGSSGNSTFIRADRDAILIDAGKSCAALVRGITSAGGVISDIRAVFVTHEHRDHVSALEVAAKKYGMPIHITEDSLRELSGGYLHDCAVPHPPLFSVDVGPMTVRSFLTHHDSVMSVGYTVDFDGSDIRLGLLTDTGHVSDDMVDALFGCTHVIIESNHDIGMLTRGPYPFFLKERILSANGHLSNDDCASIACRLQSQGTHAFTLAHLSRENNTPDMAYRAVRAALDGAGQPFSLNVALPDSPRKVI